MILVAGSNGHVGREIVKKLSLKKVKSRCFDLQPPDIPDIDISNMEVMTGSITDPETVSGALHGIKTVMFVIGLKKQTKNLTHERIEHAGMKNLIEAAKKKGVERIMYISALGAGSGVPASSLSAKWNTEQSLINSGIPYTIFRPSGYFVDFAEFFVPTIRDRGKFTIIGDGNITLQPLAPEDLAEAFIQSIDNPAALNKVIKIAGPEVYTLNEIVEIAARVAGREVKVKRLPFWLMNIVFSAMTFMTGSRGGKDFLYRMSRDSVCSDEEMRELKSIFNIEFKRVEPWLKEAVGYQDTGDSRT